MRGRYHSHVQLARALPAIVAFTLVGCAGSADRDAASLFGPGGEARLERIRAGGAGIEVPGIAVARFGADGRIEALATGCARFEADGRTCAVELTPDSAMRVASISKLVTGIAAMRLIAAGTLELDSDISDYLGFTVRNPSFPDTPITLRHLMSHVSSLRDGEIYWAPHPQTLEALLREPGRFDPAHAPGEYFTYSNLGFGVVGALVECVARERFDRYMTRTILAPAGVQAGYNWSGLESLDPDRVTTLYRKQDANGEWHPEGPWIAQVDDFGGSAPQVLVNVGEGSGPPPADYRLCSNGTLFSPHGGLRISIRDLARIVQEALRDGTLARMQVEQWRFDPGAANGATYNALYRFGLALHLNVARTGMAGHLAAAYGLKGGVLIDFERRRGWIYLITGTARPHVVASPPAGIDTTEAAVIDALGLRRTSADGG